MNVCVSSFHLFACTFDSFSQVISNLEYNRQIAMRRTDAIAIA